MPTKKIEVQPVRPVQINLFPPPSRSLPSWDQMPEAVKVRVVEALAEVLLRAGAGASERKEALDE